MTTVTPAYGRDYTSAKKAVADWQAGKDFIIADIHDQYDGKPINIDDALRAGISVMIRYKRLTQICKAPMTKKKALPQVRLSDVGREINNVIGRQS